MLRYRSAIQKAHAFEFDGRGMILLCWNNSDRVNQLEGLSEPELLSEAVAANSDKSCLLPTGKPSHGSDWLVKPQGLCKVWQTLNPPVLGRV